MKLINQDHSPYAARVRILIRKKNLPIESIASPFPLKTDEFLEAFPLAKLPLLELDNGEYLPESVAILEFLEDIFSDNPLRPSDPLACARSRVMMSFTDTHLGSALSPLFRALLLPESGVDTQAQIQVLLNELGKLDRWLASGTSCTERSIHMGDAVLAPSVWYTIIVSGIFGEQNILKGFEHIEQWWEWVNNDADVKAVLNEMDVAFKAFTSNR